MWTIVHNGRPISDPDIGPHHRNEHVAYRLARSYARKRGGLTYDTPDGPSAGTGIPDVQVWRDWRPIR